MAMLAARLPHAKPRAIRRATQAQRRVLAGSKNSSDNGSPYRDTVNLPSTEFPMRANAVVREPEIQQWWEQERIYERCLEQASGEPFTLHDGPPYANGELHIGHALNKMLKDFVNRYMLMRGRKARFVPGWDTHGLPIELQVLQNMSEDERNGLSAVELRRRATDFAISTMEHQKRGFKRYGVWADWEDPYLTLTPQYEAAQIDVFSQMYLRGYIYRGLKPVHWSPSTGTALAEAELEYPDDHTSKSVFVGMPLTWWGKGCPDEMKRVQGEILFAIWTTTPWTIPANQAIAVNPSLDYVLARQGAPLKNTEPASLEGSHVIVAKDLLDHLSSKAGRKLEVVSELRGDRLEGCWYRHPIFGSERPVVIGGDYITTDSGTGLVHTAPGHGNEDFQVGMKQGLPMVSPVDSEGKFTEEAGGEFVGLDVLKEGNKRVIRCLADSGCLFHVENYKHRYPYDWRSKQPTIFRATEQWFASIDGFRQEAIDEIGKVRWSPPSGEKRVKTMVESREDWCISRQRIWGVPIPAFYDKGTGEPFMNEDTLTHFRDIVAKHGTDVWWLWEVKDLLPEKHKHLADTLEKGCDTMDVWFDSGTSWNAVVNQHKELNFPADMYLEGSDQHRGWFQSSLLTSVATKGFAPYKCATSVNGQGEEKEWSPLVIAAELLLSR